MRLPTKMAAALCAVLFCGLLIAFASTDVLAANKKSPIITVLNPLGTPPPITLSPMAPRLDTLAGKTIYIVNDGYPGSGILLGELTKVMKEKYPGTTFVYKDKPGGMGSEDAGLWKEMADKADAMIIALGH
jgi:hypothetical protein